tara:strand:+ start:205 stop:417 length:213 start_codon:yes stop_codon:yes gene_type:complete
MYKITNNQTGSFLYLTSDELKRFIKKNGKDKYSYKRIKQYDIDKILEITTSIVFFISIIIYFYFITWITY